MPDDISEGIDAGIDQQTMAAAAEDAGSGGTGGGGGGGGGTMSDQIRLEIAEVFEGVQLGIESTPGAAATDFRRLRSLMVELQPHFQITPVESNGYIVPTDIVYGKEWSDIDFSGDLAFNDLIYLLASRAGVPIVTADVNFPTVQYWDWVLKSNQPSQIQTFNHQKGQTSSSASAPGGFVNSLDFAIDDKTIKVTGKGMGQKLTDGTALTAGAVDVPQIMATSALVDVFMAATENGLAANQIDRGLGVKLSLPDRSGAIMTLDSRQQSYSATVQKGAPPTATVEVMKNSDSIAYMNQLRARILGFTRVVMSGPEIGVTGISYGAQWTYPYKYKDNKRSGIQDASGSTFDQQIIDNAAFGGYLKFRVTTDMTLAASGLFPAGSTGALTFTGTNAPSNMANAAEVYNTITGVVVSANTNNPVTAMSNGWTVAFTTDGGGVANSVTLGYPAGTDLTGLEFRIADTVAAVVHNLSVPLCKS